MTKSKKILVTIFVISAFIMGIITGFVIPAFSAYFKYDINYIIGQHYTEIINTYGEFDSGTGEFVSKDKRHYYYDINNCLKYYKPQNAGTYKTFNLFQATIGPDDQTLYPHIIIEFDENGFAKSVSKGYFAFPGG